MQVATLINHCKLMAPLVGALISALLLPLLVLARADSSWQEMVTELESSSGPWPNQAERSDCLDFWQRHNLSAHFQEPANSGRAFARLLQLLSGRPARNVALLEHLEQCARLMDAKSLGPSSPSAPKRLLVLERQNSQGGSGSAMAVAVAAPSGTPSLGPLTQSQASAGSASSSSSSGPLDEALADLERLRLRLANAAAKRNSCECGTAGSASEQVSGPGTSSHSASLARVRELQEEREKLVNELEQTRTRTRSTEGQLQFKLAERDSELDNCRKQSSRRLEIIKQATRMVDEMSKDMKERGLASAA